jgi:hypothetical protein
MTHGDSQQTTTRTTRVVAPRNFRQLNGGSDSPPESPTYRFSQNLDDDSDNSILSDDSTLGITQKPSKERKKRSIIHRHFDTSEHGKTTAKCILCDFTTDISKSTTHTLNHLESHNIVRPNKLL